MHFFYPSKALHTLCFCSGSKRTEQNGSRQGSYTRKYSSTRLQQQDIAKNFPLLKEQVW